jgi:hypothetical protein
VVRRQFDSELGRSVERMRDAIAPYTRFVRTEHARMTAASAVLSEVDAEIDAPKAEIAAPDVGPGSPS